MSRKSAFKSLSKMKIPFYLVEAFNDRKSGMRGNIAAVLHLEKELSTGKMLEIAEDLAQPASCFLFKKPQEPNSFKIRWFAPIAEIGLCGHGSLAAIATLEKQIQINQKIKLEYPQGEILGKLLAKDLGSISLEGIKVKETKPNTTELEKALGQKVLEHYYTNNKDIVVLENEKALQSMKPNFEALRKLESFGYSVTAEGDKVDFVSRTLIPFVPILEDQATGSSHASLGPFWAKRLNKNKLEAIQLSKRIGKFSLQMDADCISLKGNYSILSQGEISI